MKRAIGAALAVAMFAVPATAVAKPIKPAKVDRKAAVQDCRAERAADADAFREEYGTNKNKRNAFGRCVRQTARANAVERRAERRHAAKDCRAEREEIGVEAFRDKYGANDNKRNAFGKCVSQTVRAERRNAAKDCRAERAEDGDAFREKYGTGPNNRNAFGKCVSETVKANREDDDELEVEVETTVEA
jgi:hypothetical protein